MPNIEEHLRNAMAEGKFDNLPGKGKPLHLDETNPHADPKWELAYRMLKDSGFSLPWIETIREIEQDIAAARKDLRVAWEWYQSSLSVSNPSSEPSADWERSQTAFKDKIASLNKRIRDYNLQVPNARFQRPVLNFDQELKLASGLNKSTFQP
jgi:DnaJ family protein C protein 28